MREPVSSPRSVQASHRWKRPRLPGVRRAPAVITNWVREFQEVVDFQFGEGSPREPVFDLRVAHEVGARYNLTLNRSFTHRLLTNDDGWGPTGAYKVFVLTASKSIRTRLTDVLDTAWDRHAARQKGRSVPILRYSCCTCFVDGHHQFRNPGLITEIPLRRLARKTQPRFRGYPLYEGALFLLSGTPGKRVRPT